jgi:hypothetical protein
MGFFDKKYECAICNTMTRLKTYELANGESLCVNCHTLSGMGFFEKTEQYTVEDIKNKIIEEKTKKLAEEKLEQEKKEQIEKFTSTFYIDDKIHFDDNDKKWLIPDGFFGGIKNPHIYDYRDIIDYQIIQEEHVDYNHDDEDKGPETICDRLSVLIALNSTTNSTKEISFAYKTKKDARFYRNRVDEMNKLVFQLKRVIQYNKQERYKAVQEARAAQVEEQEEAEVVQVVNNVSAADEIMKFKGLLDAGIISLEEFNAKKEQLLDL